MNISFKPTGYSSVSAYFIIPKAEQFMALMITVFDAKELRCYKQPDGSIMHAEMQLDDSVIMLGQASEKFPAVPMVMHVYVSNVDEVFAKAIDAGCEIIQNPKQNENDPDRRATFKDYAGNMWSVGTQIVE